MLYIENPKENYWSSSMNLVKLQVTKLVHINLLHFYILTMKDQKEKFKKTTPFTISLRRISRNKPTEGDTRPIL